MAQTQSCYPVQLPLMCNPWPMIIIVSAYLLIVLKLGRKFMENREPFDLKGVIKAYNIFQITYNSLLLSAVSKF